MKPPSAELRTTKQAGRPKGKLPAGTKRGSAELQCRDTWLACWTRVPSCLYSSDHA
nr:unnamed protein product [Digitaria exilis]